MVTGDNKVTAKAIALEIGLFNKSRGPHDFFGILAW